MKVIACESVLVKAEKLTHSERGTREVWISVNVNDVKEVI